MADPYAVGKRYGSRGRGYADAASGFEMENGKPPTRAQFDDIRRGVDDGKKEAHRGWPKRVP